MNASELQKKDAGVELLRIIGCLIVIACHCVVQYKFDDGYHWANTTIACHWADGVAIFWLVTGFFLFRHDDLARKAAGFARRRLLPALAVIIFLFYFYDFLTSDATLLQSVTHAPQDYGNVLLGFLKLQSNAPKTGHFWYVIIYVLVLAAFPALNGFYKWLKEKGRRQVWFCAISFAALAVNDVLKNETFAFTNLSINALVPSCIFIIWGALLYDHREKLLGIPQTVAALPLFVGLNMLRALAIVIRNEAHELYWFTTFGLLCAIFMMTFCLNVGRLMQGRKAGTAISWLGQHTFMIYLIHYAVKDMLSYWGYKDWVRKVSPPGTPLKVVGYTLMMALAVFAVSLVIAAALHYLKELVFYIFKGKKNGKAKRSGGVS